MSRRLMPKVARARPSHVPAISLFIGLFILAAAIGDAWHSMPRTASGAQVRVIDGDSLRAGSEDIRLVGIDAPELSQTCRNAQGRAWPCGDAAKTRLRELVSRGTVACAPRGRDRYGRTLAVCSAGDIADLGQVLVREGYAVNYSLSDAGYPAAEREARNARRGLWQGEFETPQAWRRRHSRSG